MGGKRLYFNMSHAKCLETTAQRRELQYKKNKEEDLNQEPILKSSTQMNSPTTDLQHVTSAVCAHNCKSDHPLIPDLNIQ